MIVSKASPQLQNILDLKGQERSSSKKDEGASFAENLKNKSKKSPLSSYDSKPKKQDIRETFQDLAGGNPQNMSQSSARKLEGQVARNSQTANEAPVTLEETVQRGKRGEQNLLNKVGKTTPLESLSLDSSKMNPEMMEAGLSEKATEGSEELAQLKDLAQINDSASLDALDGVALQKSENLTFDLQNEEALSSPLSTTSSDMERKTLENSGPENKSVLSEIMKEMDHIENPRVLDSLKNYQKMSVPIQDKVVGQSNLKENFKSQEMLQSNMLDPVVPSQASPADSLLPVVSGTGGGLGFGENTSEFNQDMAEGSSEFTSNFAPMDQQNSIDFAKPLADATTPILGNTDPESKIENMSSIVRQARAIVDDGGGSMEIHLQPEGLGKVQLKIAIHDGRINVEMMTDNPAAKKALEEGLFEVRNALEGQKLLVDTLKVEMGQNVQKDFTDMRDHMQEQQNRDFAQDFLEQFRQDRESRFGGLIDRFRNSPSPTGDNELKLTRNNPYADAGKGRTLNLVA